MSVTQSTQVSQVSLVAPVIEEEEIEAVVEVLRSGQLAQGPIVAAFEQEFADVVGTKHAVAVNSGTAAVHCAVRAVGVSVGDEVLTTPFTFAATATPVLMERASIRFVDVDPVTFNVDLASYARAANHRTKAVIAVDLFGLPADLSAANDLRGCGIRIIEDACQAIGASRDGVNAGAASDVAAFSLYATKNLMTGEGGMLTTNSDEVAEIAKRFRQHGQGARYEYLDLGYNYRLTDVLAAIGRKQLQRLREITDGRRRNAKFYDDALSGIPGVTIPSVPLGVQHCYHQYTVLIDGSATVSGTDRDGVRLALSQAGIGSGIYYPKPLHLHPLFGGPHREGEFPNAERLAKQVLSLPIHPKLTLPELEYVANTLRKAVGA